MVQGRDGYGYAGLVISSSTSRCQTQVSSFVPISISEVDYDKKEATIVYRVSVRNSHLLQDAVAGQTIDTMGPQGNGFDISLLKLGRKPPSWWRHGCHLGWDGTCWRLRELKLYHHWFCHDVIWVIPQSLCLRDDWWRFIRYQGLLDSYGFDFSPRCV